MGVVLIQGVCGNNLVRDGCKGQDRSQGSMVNMSAKQWAVREKEGKYDHRVPVLE